MSTSKQIANKTGIPEKIVEQVIQEYLPMLKTDIEQNSEITIEGLGKFRKIELRLQPGCELVVLDGKNEYTTLGRIEIRHTEFTSE